MKWNEMKWNGMKSIIPSAMNQTLICDIETHDFLDFTGETLSDLWSENLDIKLNSDCDSNN
jgi:hypothetical protein